eukprot:2467592-Pyramimonas_sp.AAC.1
MGHVGDVLAGCYVGRGGAGRDVHMGPPDACIPVTEANVRMLCRNTLRLGRDKYYRALAAFPHQPSRGPQRTRCAST